MATGDVAKDCAILISEERFEEALAPCRQAFEADPAGSEARRRLAAAEYEAGEAGRAVELLRSLIETEGFTQPLGTAIGNALWRAGKTAEAEDTFRRHAALHHSREAYRDLLRLLFGFDRQAEALAVAEEATARFPKDCDLVEDLGAALAGVARDEDAARSFERSIRLGCPPCRFTTRGVVGTRLTLAPYGKLLDPAKLAAGLAKLDDEEALLRLKLLRDRMRPDLAPAVAEAALRAPSFSVGAQALGRLEELGCQAMASWQRVIDGGHLELRKYALRRIREMQDPEFIPLLESFFAKETLPGNRSFLALSLGELYLKKGDGVRGASLLRTIHEDDPLYVAACLAQMADAESRGDYREALNLFEAARHKEPGTQIDPDREARLRKAAEGQ